jgi:hypothetical protein
VGEGPAIGSQGLQLGVRGGHVVFEFVQEEEERAVIGMKGLGMQPVSRRVCEAVFLCLSS